MYFGAGRATGSMIGAWLWRALRSRATLQVNSIKITTIKNNVYNNYRIAQVFSLLSIVLAVFYAAASSLLPPSPSDGCDKKIKHVPTQDVNHVEKAES